MSDSQRQDKKLKSEKLVPRFEEEAEAEEPKEEPKVAKPAAAEKPKKEAKAEEPKEPVVEVDFEKVLRWAARMRFGFGAWLNGANFGRHMIRDSFRIDGEQLSADEASRLINKFIS
jgi:hypothetical protein